MEIQELELLRQLSFKIRIYGINTNIPQTIVHTALSPIFGHIESIKIISTDQMVVRVQTEDKKYEEFREKQNSLIHGQGVGEFKFKILDYQSQMEQKNLIKSFFIHYSTPFKISIVLLIILILISFLTSEEKRNQAEEPLVEAQIDGENKQEIGYDQNKENEQLEEKYMRKNDNKIYHEILGDNDLNKIKQNTESYFAAKNANKVNEPDQNKFTKENTVKSESRTQQTLNMMGGPSIKTHFITNNKKHIAQEWKLDPIQFESWMEDYEYLMPATTIVLRFPQDNWKNKQQPPLAYKLSEKQLQQFLNSLKREINKDISEKKEQEQYLIYKNFLTHFNTPKYIETQYRYLNQKYNLDSLVDEVKICVVATGSDFEEENKFMDFLKTASGQNYTNYQIFYIDDGSENEDYRQIYGIVDDNYPSLRSKITFLRKQQRLGNLANKDATINQFCPKDSIVVDVAANQFFVGHQVFKIINSLYSRNQNIWVSYSKGINIMEGSNYNLYEAGNSEPLDVDVSQYRNPMVPFTTNQLKIYRASLFHKIPLQHLTEVEASEDDMQIVKYFSTADQLAIMYSLMQMAGNQRVYFIPEYLSVLRNIDRTPCQEAIISYDSIKIQSLERLSKLNSFEDEPMTEAGDHVSNEYVDTAQKYKWQKCRL